MPRYCFQGQAQPSGPPAKQDAVLPYRDTANHKLGIFIVDGLTGFTHKARAIVALGNTIIEAGSAVAAIFHLFFNETFDKIEHF